MACLTYRGTINSPFKDSMQSLNSLSIVCQQMESLREERDKMIYDLFADGFRQKSIAEHCGLSESRVKGICQEQKKLAKKP